MDPIEIQAATAAHWPDLEGLFGPNGAYSGCWCMFLRSSSKVFVENCRSGGAANKVALQALLKSGAEPGLLAYRAGAAVGWVAVAPREEYGRVLRSPIHKPIDEQGPVYSVSCFFVAKEARGTGTADRLLEAAIEFARHRGARLLEAYPSNSGATRRPAADVWRGTVGQFERAGFEIVERRKPARPIMRLFL